MSQVTLFYGRVFPIFRKKSIISKNSKSKIWETISLHLWRKKEILQLLAESDHLRWSPLLKLLVEPHLFFSFHPHFCCNHCSYMPSMVSQYVCNVLNWQRISLAALYNKALQSLPKDPKPVLAHLLRMVSKEKTNLGRIFSWNFLDFMLVLLALHLDFLWVYFNSC